MKTYKLQILLAKNVFINIDGENRADVREKVRLMLSSDGFTDLEVDGLEVLSVDFKEEDYYNEKI